MPLFGVQFAPSTGAANFMRGVQQGAQMSQSAQSLQENRRQFDAMGPMREAQARVQQALASKLEGVLQGEIDATNARNAQAGVQAELQTGLLTEQVASTALGNEVAQYQFEETQALEPQRRATAAAEAYLAELGARRAQLEFDEFTSPEATRIRSYTRDATARLLGQQLESAQTQDKLAKSKLEAEQFAFQRMQATASAQDLSDEAYAAGFGAIRNFLPDELADAAQGILDADDPDMTPSMKGAAVKKVVSDYFEQKSFQYARDATVNMTTLRRKMAEMPQLLQDADFSRGLTALAQAQQRNQYGMAAALTQSLIGAADAIEFSIKRQAEGLGLVASVQEMYGGLGASALNTNKLPEDLGDRSMMNPSSWLDRQQSELESLAEDRLTQSEWHRWIIQTLDPLDISAQPELMAIKLESQQWVIDTMQQREALGRLTTSARAPSNNKSTLSGSTDTTDVGSSTDVQSAFSNVQIGNSPK